MRLMSAISIIVILMSMFFDSGVLLVIGFVLCLISLIQEFLDDKFL